MFCTPEGFVSQEMESYLTRIIQPVLSPVFERLTLYNQPVQLTMSSPFPSPLSCRGPNINPFASASAAFRPASSAPSQLTEQDTLANLPHNSSIIPQIFNPDQTFHYVGSETLLLQDR